MQTMIIGMLSLLLRVQPLLAQSGTEPTAPLSVCELIERRNKYNGQIVTVQGEVKGGPHGTWLKPDSPCPYKLVTRGVEWPIEIFLTYPSEQSPDRTDHANFKVDMASVLKSQGIVRRAGFSPSRDAVIKTYVGLFVTYRDLDTRVNPDTPGAARLGFGPVGVETPAKLLIKEVRDSRVVHGKRQDRKEEKQ